MMGQLDDEMMGKTIDFRNMDLAGLKIALVEAETTDPFLAEEPSASYNPRYKDNLIVDLTFKFALSIWDLSEQLQSKRRFALANQLFRSGTAIGALVREAQNAESLADFVHKMKIAIKEADETEYWLLLCISREVPGASNCLDALTPILKVLNKIISTSKKKRTRDDRGNG